MTDLAEPIMLNIITQTFCMCAGARDIRSRRQDNKFFTTVACKYIGVAIGFFHNLGNPLQNLVTNQVAIFVIDLLEPVEIEKNDGKSSTVAFHPVDFSIKEMAEMQPVIDICQRVCVGHQAHLLMQ